ncbi:MAG: HEPN domain-containing protein [Actinomycetia bacterium]|nr:HEPN domain-containing protein [Actinomycetota bacterium]MCG2791324.1 HEPN domain-containing protein [Actinomycetes bacterium]
MKTIQEFIDKGLIKKDDNIDSSQVLGVLKKSRRSIKSAKLLIEDDQENSYQLAYEAMLHAGRALVFSFGFRPRAAGSHKIVVDFSKKVLGKEIATLVFKFNKMRKIRHYLVYGTGLYISEVDSRNAISSAVKFLRYVIRFIKDKNREKN